MYDTANVCRQLFVYLLVTNFYQPQYTHSPLWLEFDEVKITLVGKGYLGSLELRRGIHTHKR